MKLIDEQGKLFGMINIIDLLVLLLLLVLAMAGIGRFTGRAARHEPGATTINLEVLISEVRQQTVDAIEVGDVVFDSTSGSVFGMIQDKKVVPFRKPAETAAGGFVLADVPGRFDIYLELECSGHDPGNVLRIASHEIRIGTFVILQTRDYSVGGNVLRIDARKQE